MNWLKFDFQGTTYSGFTNETDPYLMCCDILKKEGVDFTDTDTFDLIHFSKRKTFVTLEEETA